MREHWQGASLPGDFILEQWLGGDPDAAFFQTSLPHDGRRAIVKLIPEAAVDSHAQLALWHRTRQLRHPNLIELLDFGRADLDREIVLYAVFESHDDTLANALSQQPLNSQESREVLDSVIDAVRYLHAQGLAAGVLDPDHIVAVGDRIKLSTDSLREAADSVAPAEDIRALGELWKLALLPASPRSAEIAAHAADPDPHTRWTLAEISAALTPPVTVAPPAVVAVPVDPEPVVAPPPAVTLPPVVSAPLLPPPHRPAPKPAVPYNFPKWIVVGTAGLLLLILGLNLRRSTPVATSHTPIAPVSAPVDTPTLPPPAAAPVPVPVKPSPSAGREMWRVIAFTYRTRDAAAKKVHQLNQHHPDLHATVFSPRERRGYYLVSLGGRMTREDAVRLQRSAKGKGLPRDLYVQNYSE
jgi:hypothetical protein